MSHRTCSEPRTNFLQREVYKRNNRPKVEAEGGRGIHVLVCILNRAHLIPRGRKENGELQSAFPGLCNIPASSVDLFTTDTEKAKLWAI